MDENEAVFQAWLESCCVTFGNLCDLSMPSCSSSINEIASTGLASVTRFGKRQTRWANKLFDNLDFPFQRERDFLLLRLKSTVQRERVKEGSDSGAKE